jgi:alkanesulfonate monooxygenase SsuD/methylene tetrahydromethanopterin reductase-like flavin-dependent oxidoreductase (luciferase family)
LWVTDDEAAARGRLAEILVGTMQRPQFRVAIDREGLKSAADVALVGDEEKVAAGIEKYAAAGVTDLGALLSPTRRLASNPGLCWLLSSRVAQSERRRAVLNPG